MATKTFNEFTDGGVPNLADYAVGYTNPNADGERRWTISNLKTAICTDITGIAPVGSAKDLVSGIMGGNDFFRIRISGDAGTASSGGGQVELATADDGTEPIYVRQYSGATINNVWHPYGGGIKNQITLLDAAGNTTLQKLISPNMSGATPAWIRIDMGNDPGGWIRGKGMYIVDHKDFGSAAANVERPLIRIGNWDNILFFSREKAQVGGWDGNFAWFHADGSHAAMTGQLWLGGARIHLTGDGGGHGWIMGNGSGAETARAAIGIIQTAGTGAVTGLTFNHNGAQRLHLHSDNNAYFSGNIYLRNGYGHSMYIGGDAAGNDFQIGSNQKGINTLAFWNQAEGITMDTLHRNIIAQGTISTQGFAVLPTGWGGGVNTWDVYANGSIGVGVKGSLSGIWSNDGQIHIRNGAPTIYLRDQDHRSAMIHVNSSRFYILRAAGDTGKDVTSWEPLPGKGWPMELNLDTGDSHFAGTVYSNGSKVLTEAVATSNQRGSAFRAFPDKECYQGSSMYRINAYLGKDGAPYMTGYSWGEFSGRGGQRYDSTTTFDRASVWFESGEHGVKFYMNRTNMAILTNKGNVYMCGYNIYGNLGINWTDNGPAGQWVRVPIGGVVWFSMCNTEANATHCLAVLGNGQLYGWGANHYGQLGLGNGGASFYRGPVLLSNSGALNGKKIKKAWAIGDDYTNYGSSWVTDENDNLYCTGINGRGQLGFGHTTTINTWTAHNLKARKVQAKGWNTEATTYVITPDNKLFIAGANHYGQLGNGSTTHVYTFVERNLGQAVKDISIGDYYGGSVVAILNDNTVRVWGRNNQGQLGTNDTNNKLSPMNISIGNVKQAEIIDRDYCTTALLLHSGEILGSGYNHYGQIGQGYYTTRELTFRHAIKPFDQKFVDVYGWGQVSGTGFTAADQEGNIYTVGYGDQGTLGSFSDRYSRPYYAKSSLHM